MLSSTDHDKLQQIMQENPENEALINRLLTSHQMEISTISHEIRNPLTLVYSTLQLIESQLLTADIDKRCQMCQCK